MTEEPLFRSGWEVEGIRDGERFFRSLGQFLPAPAYLVFEGVSIAGDVRQLLESNAVTPRRHIPTGTLFPRPVSLHVPASDPLLARLAALAANHAEPELCDHFHAYSDERGLVQWYDAFDLPLLVDGSIVEFQLRRFCAELGATCRRWQAG